VQASNKTHIANNPIMRMTNLLLSKTTVSENASASLANHIARI